MIPGNNATFKFFDDVFAEVTLVTQQIRSLEKRWTAPGPPN